MNKNDFRKKLLDGLEIFTEDEQKKIVDGYLEKFTGKEDVDSILREIYLNHGIDEDKVINKKGFFYRQFEKLFEAIHQVVDEMSLHTFKENVKIFLDILLILLIIIIFRIPFIFIRDIVDNLLLNVDAPILLEVWGFVVDIAYIIFAIMLFINIFTKWFRNLNIEKKPEKIQGKELESISLNEKK